MATVLAVVLVSCGACVAGENSPPSVDRTELLLDTVVRIRASGDGALSGVEEAFAAVRRVEMLLSRFREDSEVTRINLAAGVSPVKVQPDTFSLLERAAALSGETGGAFDVTVGPLLNAWGFGKSRQAVPSADALRDALAKVGYERLVLDDRDRSVFLRDRGMVVDLGGVAKGFAVDAATEALRRAGVQSALVDAGGDIRLVGRRPDGGEWRIGVQDPRAAPGQVMAVIRLAEGAVATSGDYARFFVQDKERYHHILDPHTGLPARGCLSVTVVAGDATEADMLATAIFVMGPERGREFLEARGSIGGIIVDEGGNIFVSRNLRRSVSVSWWRALWLKVRLFRERQAGRLRRERIGYTGERAGKAKLGSKTFLIGKCRT